MVQVDYSGEKGSERLSGSFWSAQDKLNQALGELDVAAKAGNQAGIFKAQQKVQKQMQIMSTLSNMSQTIHNLLMKLIDKLNIRS